MVEDGVTAVEGLYRKAELPLVVDVPADLPLLYVDPTQVRQVLINLLTNAIRYTDVGSVRILARRDHGEVVVSVSDTGAGIRRRTYRTCSRAFVRLASRTVRVDSGLD